MKVILDTNFLIYCAKERIDYREALSDLIREKVEIVVPTQVVEELNKVMHKEKSRIPFVRRTARFRKTTGRDKEAASLALQILQMQINGGYVQMLTREGKRVDDVLLQLAQEDRKSIVCTLDREMRKKLPRVILLNRNKQLVLSR